MRTGLYSFDQIIQDVAQETGITNLRNRYGEIRQLISRAEREINPYAGFLIKKKMLHFVGNKVFDGKSIKKPADFVQIDKVGCCEDGLCEGSYFENVSHVIICDKKERTSITWTYWALQSDGNGNPFTSWNHSEAVVAYIVWKLYSAKVFLNEGSAGLRREYKDEWENRCMEARGEDMFPSVDQLDRMFQMNKWSSLHFENMTQYDRCISCESCMTTIEETDPSTIIPTLMTPKVYYWQLADTIADIHDVLPLINPTYIATKPFEYLHIFDAGHTVINTGIGRIVFSIHESEFIQYKFIDALGLDVTHAFEKHYDVEQKIMTYVSKNPYTISNILFKIKNL